MLHPPPPHRLQQEPVRQFRQRSLAEFPSPPPPRSPPFLSGRERLPLRDNRPLPPCPGRRCLRFREFRARRSLSPACPGNVRRPDTLGPVSLERSAWTGHSDSSPTFIPSWNPTSCSVCFLWEPWFSSGPCLSFRCLTPSPSGAGDGEAEEAVPAEVEAVRRPAIEAGPRSQPRTADPPWSIRNRTRAARESIAPAPLRGGLPVPGLGPPPPMRVRSGLVRERSEVSREQRVPATPPPRPTVPTSVARSRPVRPGPATALASSPPIR